MMRDPRVVTLAIAALASTVTGCSSDKGTGRAMGAAAGGAIQGTGGARAATGGAITGGTSGIAAASGGMTGSGGATAVTGGAATGGASALVQASGGNKATGGAPAATGGVGTGGSNGIATGGSNAATGGTRANGGTLGTGGANLVTGGNAGTGGAATGGAATGGSTSVDPSVSTAMNACIDKLPYGGRDLSVAARAPIITAIVHSCAAFAPPGSQWQTWCQMFLVAAINAESSFNTQAGTAGAGSDPSVGLLQIRFSSVVRDFADYGPVSAMPSIGCDFGSVTSSDTYATKGAMMVDVNCNVAIGAWYYFIFASGNGGSSVVWVDQYCMGSGGVAGNLHIGMASFLMGGDAAHSSLSGADYYVNEIKGWFDPCVTYTGTHPFELTIQPNRAQYCR